MLTPLKIAHRRLRCQEDENQLSDGAKNLLQNAEMVDMAERGRELAKQRELEFQRKLDEPEERKKTRRETFNLGIALLALFVSLYSILATHRDAQENLHQTERAYVTLEPANLTTGAPPSAGLTIKVAGQSPARKIQLNAGCIVSQETKADDVTSRASLTRYSGNPILVPGSTFEVPACVRATSVFDIAQDSYIANGELTYEDIFGKPHHVNFCFATYGNTRLFPCETGNDAD